MDIDTVSVQIVDEDYFADKENDADDLSVQIVEVGSARTDTSVEIVAENVGTKKNDDAEMG